MYYSNLFFLFVATHSVKFNIIPQFPFSPLPSFLFDERCRMNECVEACVFYFTIGI